MTAPVGPGDVLAGKYRVERVLGHGGMGVVVAARHLQLDQVVALKFLLPEALASQEAVGRFLREARNAVRLRSEHVARIIDVGTLENGSPYIVMEFLEGMDLQALLASNGALPIAMLVDYVLQACDAIAEAHASGIVHRDLKPPNLFLTRGHDRTGLVKVLDFGISKSTVVGDLVATRTQAVMGSPAYMSPEQMRSAKNVDARTDIWSLGVILFQLASGRLPFDGETFTELCLRVAMDPTPPLVAAAPLPSGFEAVVHRCLEKDPDRRYADVYQLALALAPYAPPHARPLVERIGRVLSGDGVSLPSAVSSAPGTIDTFQQASGQQVPRRRGRRFAAVAGSLVVVAAAIGVAVGVAGSGGSSESADKPQVEPTAQPRMSQPAPTAAPVLAPRAAPVVSAPAPAPPAPALPAPAPPAAAAPPPPITTAAPQAVDTKPAHSPPKHASRPRPAPVTPTPAPNTAAKPPPAAPPPPPEDPLSSPD